MEFVQKIFNLKVPGFRLKKQNTYVIMGGIILAVLMVFMAINYAINQRLISSLTKRTYMEIATKQFEFIEEWMELRVENTEKIAGAPDVIAALNLTAATGRAAPLAKDYINGIMLDQGVYSGIVLLGRGGKVCHATSALWADIAVKRINNEIRNSDDVHIAAPVILTGTKNRSVSQPISYPVYQLPGERGAITGHVVTFINMAILEDSISMINLGEGGHAYLSDRDGRLILSSGQFEYRNGDGGFILADPESGKPVDGVSRCVADKTAGSGEYTGHLGNTVIGIWKWYSYFEWVFLIEVDRRHALSSVRAMVAFYLVSALIFMAVIALVVYYAFGKTMKPINRIIATIRKMSTGDLMVRTGIDKKSEIGDIGESLDQFLDEISGIVKNMMDISMQLASAASEMSASSGFFTENVQKQAASAEEIMSTVEELSSGLESVSDGANDQFTSLSALVERMHELSDTINGMGIRVKEGLGLTGQISEKAQSGGASLNAMNLSMSSLGKRSEEMTNIIEIINGISEQVNLLALNAAIEAARAGDAGRGFAVVADEIGKLADQTASSLKEIDSLVRGNKDEIRKGIDSASTAGRVMSDIIEGVETIARMMDLIFQNMEKQLSSNEIVNTEAGKVQEMANTIRAATDEQKIAAEEIVKAVSYINELSQKNSASSEEMSANAEELSAIAESLSSRVAFFKV